MPYTITERICCMQLGLRQYVRVDLFQFILLSCLNLTLFLAQFCFVRVYNVNMFCIYQPLILLIFFSHRRPRFIGFLIFFVFYLLIPFRFPFILIVDIYLSILFLNRISGQTESTFSIMQNLR